MNIILIGAPGAGKGTQAKKLSAMLNIPHISTGDIFREQIALKTDLGIVADKYISKGMLVPDEITMSVIRERLHRDDCGDGFIFDGFPRTLVQAEELDKILKDLGRKIDFVINIVVDEDVLIDRLVNRRVCPECKAIFNLETIASREMCPNCSTPLIQREDDNVRIIKQRFIAYHDLTEPLINYYSAKNVLTNVKSMSRIEDSLRNTLEAIGILK